MASEKDPKPSSSDLFSSAKLLAGAAKSSFSNESDKVDKAKVAGAAADLLDAAQDYGKLDKDKGIGQHIEKAENYLHQYETSGQPAPTTTGSGTPNKAEAHPESHESGGDGKDSGSGGYLKMAQGFLSK